MNITDKSLKEKYVLPYFVSLNEIPPMAMNLMDLLFFCLFLALYTIFEGLFYYLKSRFAEREGEIFHPLVYS